jgi:deazaflavin-dependent oxidoreductase (nitroreductase family)
MKDSPRFPLVFWRMISRLNQRLVSGYGPKSKTRYRVLVLTTLGRKSGLPRSTPLQFEEVDGVYYVASARGKKADWYRNLLSNPQAEVRVKDKNFHTCAELITEPGEIADFLELRLKRHPGFMGIMLRLEGLQRKYTRTDLEKFAERLAIVTLDPDNP